MAVKTITIDMEAYDLLASQKENGESFSKVIKRRFGATRTGAELLSGLREIVLEEETLDRVDEVVTARADSAAESPALDVED